MLRLLQKNAPVVSISLLVILLVMLVFQQDTARTLSTILIVFGLGTAILFTIHSNWVLRQAQEPHKEDGLTNAEFVRNTAIDLLGLALAMGVAMWLGRMAAGAGQVWGLLVGIVVSFGAALVVGKIWGRVSEKLRVTAA